MTQSKLVPNVHVNWDPLEEIWLGDVWPAHFYNDIKDGRVREAWHQITEWTKEDLNIIQKKLEELGVTVKRPYVDGPKELYCYPLPGFDTNINSTIEATIDKKGSDLWGRLSKPPITPRDSNSVIGDKLFFGDFPVFNCFKKLLLDYDRNHVFFPRRGIPSIGGANTVKLGKDIIFDRHYDDMPNNESRLKKMFMDFQYIEENHLKFFGSDYRIHIATAGGHCDGCFMPLREGLMLSSSYYEDYKMMFPGWRTINISEPTYIKDTKGWKNANKWRLSDLDENVYPFLNDHIEKFCPDWIGNYTETVFEVNVVVIDENNILCMGIHDSLFRELERCGITPHIVPFRARTFWDGGLHCITLDTRRKGQLKDYYPERGDSGLKQVLSRDFNYSTIEFMNSYADFIRQHGKIRL